MPQTLPARALLYALAAHQGQKRRYTGEEFIAHPIAVADLVAQFFSAPEVIAAAYLHDVAEKTGRTVEDIRALFGPRVAALVAECTNVCTEAAHPELAPAERKARERERLQAISFEARSIKLADVTSNLHDIARQNGPDAPQLIAAKEQILRAVSAGHPELLALAEQELHDARTRTAR